MFDLLETIQPSVALIDLALAEGNGMDLIRQIKEYWVGINMIGVSTYEAAIYGPKAIAAGAMGYVNKHEAIDQIIDAIRCMLDDKLFADKGLYKKTPC